MLEALREWISERRLGDIHNRLDARRGGDVVEAEVVEVAIQAQRWWWWWWRPLHRVDRRPPLEATGRRRLLLRCRLLRRRMLLLTLLLVINLTARRHNRLAPIPRSCLARTVCLLCVCSRREGRGREWDVVAVSCWLC